MLSFLNGSGSYDLSRSFVFSFLLEINDYLRSNHMKSNCKKDNMLIPSSFFSTFLTRYLSIALSTYAPILSPKTRMLPHLLTCLAGPVLG